MTCCDERTKEIGLWCSLALPSPLCGRSLGPLVKARARGMTAEKMEPKEEG
jgi:hypothetical protein